MRQSKYSTRSHISLWCYIPLMLIIDHRNGYANETCDRNITSTDSCDCELQGTFECNTKGHCSCLEGFYGIRCNKRCACAENAVSETNCDANGSCYCFEGYYGHSCQLACDCLVQNSIDVYQCDSQGYCKCKPGFKGKRCNTSCGCSEIGSVNQNCDRYGYCVCKPTHYGKKCQKECSCVHSNYTNQCDDRGHCKCLPYYYGKFCDLECSCENAFGQKCDYFGYCLCQRRFAGKMCNIKCECNNRTSTGYCDSNGYCECKPGLHGKYCNESQPTCGILNNNDWYSNYLGRVKTGRIINSQYSSHPIPWMVKFIKEGLHVCSGALLTNNWILTVRRCLSWNIDPSISIIVGDYAHNQWDVHERVYSIDRYEVYNLTDDTAVEEEQRPLLVKIGNFRLNEMPYQFDAARKVSFAYTSNIQPVCLPTPEVYSNMSEYALLSGWGPSNMYRRPTALQTTLFALVDFDKCPMYKSYRRQDVFCASGSLHNSYGCLWEHGSPLTVVHHGQHFLIGLWIKSGGSSNDCQKFEYNYFINISLYNCWINSIITSDDQ